MRRRMGRCPLKCGAKDPSDLGLTWSNKSTPPLELAANLTSHHPCGQEASVWVFPFCPDIQIFLLLFLATNRNEFYETVQTEGVSGRAEDMWLIDLSPWFTGVMIL